MLQRISSCIFPPPPLSFFEDNWFLPPLPTVPPSPRFRISHHSNGFQHCILSHAFVLNLISHLTFILVVLCGAMGHDE